MAKSVERLAHLMSHLARAETTPSISMKSTYIPKRLASSEAEAVLQTRKSIGVLGSKISYLDTGYDTDERVVIFVHGNPTSSYLWRNVIPHVQSVARCIAPDLIGMGMSDKEPNHVYTFASHYKYFSAWMDSIKLPEKVVFVLHDWGGGLGFHWCNQHRERVKALAYTETLVRSIPSWDNFPEVARNIFQAIRSSAGEDIVLNKNMFVERLLPGAIQRELTLEEMDNYRRPFKEPGESRRPTLTFPREIPVVSDGPQYVVDLVNDYNKWLKSDDSIPKLFIDADPGFFSPGIRREVKSWPNQRIVVVKGLHFVQEDSPHQIGQAVANLVKEVYRI